MHRTVVAVDAHRGETILERAPMPGGRRRRYVGRLQTNPFGGSMRTRYLALVALALVACKPQPETEEASSARMSAEGDSVKAGVSQMNAAFARQMVAGNVDSLVAYYADNA